MLGFMRPSAPVKYNSEEMNPRLPEWLKLWLTVWGVLAVVALAVPGLVAAGSYLILPGLILIAAPTIFLYSAMFAVFRHFLVIPPGLRLEASALFCSVLLGWLIAQPGAVTGHLAFRHANLPEVHPSSPVKLAGNVRLELPGSPSVKHDVTHACAALCAALLDTPGVESVTVAETGRSANAAELTFRLIPRAGDRSQGILPVEPESILEELPRAPEPQSMDDVDESLAQKKRLRQAVAASWALRLASTEKLVSDTGHVQPDQTVRITQSRNSRWGISISRAEILDRDGKALMRRSIVTGTALSAPFRFAGGGSVENYHVVVSRDHLTNGPEYPPLKPITELFQYSSLARPNVSPEPIRQLLERLRAATANPALSAGDPDLALAALWLPTVDWRHSIAHDQLDVLARALADPRIPIPAKLYDGYESKVAPELRSALGSRILNPATPNQTRAQLALLLSRMPPGTFAIMSADEQAFLHSRQLRPDVYPMIVRLADMGEPAVPELMAILESDKTLEPAYRRRPILHAVALSFATLGARAHHALPRVEALLSAGSSHIIEFREDREAWNLALARMGKPIDQFEYPELRPEYVARERNSLRHRVEHFDPQRIWTY